MEIKIFVDISYFISKLRADSEVADLDPNPRLLLVIINQYI
jgi:hypothetical protein